MSKQYKRKDVIEMLSAVSEDFDAKNTDDECDVNRRHRHRPPVAPAAQRARLRAVPGRARTGFGCQSFGGEMNDPVYHPRHYQADNGMEALDVIEAFFHDNYHLGNVFKYIARAGKKNADKHLEDLLKASFYLSREIARLS